MARQFNVGGPTTEKLLGSSLSNYNTLTAVTFSVWFKPNSLAAAGVYGSLIVNNGGIWTQGTHLAYYITSTINNLDPGAATISAGVWQHAALSFTNSGTLRTYYNGVSDGTVGPPTTTTISGSSTTVETGLNGTDVFSGSTADVAMWTVQLTDAEILALSKGARPWLIRPKSLRIYWPIDGIVSPEPDLYGNGAPHNGVVTGSTKSSGPPLMMLTPRRPSKLIIAPYNRVLMPACVT